MLQKTARYMEKWKMAAAGDRIVIGLSGGKDSVCLFHILLALGYGLEAVHVNHGIRGEEAARDEEFARELCRANHVPFHSYRFNVPEISRREHLSEEEAGRKVRRRAFFEVMEKTGAKKIALAHHGNDRAETMLFHLSRGTGLKGLVTMKPVDGVLIRPLLWAERSEIGRYAEAQQYAFVEDATNASEEYTRNKIRHSVIPVLEEINPRSVAHLCAAAEKLGGIADFIEREAKKLEKNCVQRAEGEIRIEKEAFERGDEAVRVPVLQSCIFTLCGSLADVREEHFDGLLQLFSMQTGKEISLPYGITAVRTYEGIRLFAGQECRKEEPVEISGAGEVYFGGKTFHVSVEKREKEEIFPIKTYTKCFDYDKIKGNIFLRTRKTGDYLQINRSGGTKSLQDYFVNEKIPKERRDQVAVLAEGSHILWVVGKRISEYYKVTEETKTVLKVQTDGGNEDELYSERADSAGKGRIKN